MLFCYVMFCYGYVLLCSCSVMCMLMLCKLTAHHHVYFLLRFGSVMFMFRDGYDLLYCHFPLLCFCCWFVPWLSCMVWTFAWDMNREHYISIAWLCLCFVLFMFSYVLVCYIIMYCWFVLWLSCMVSTFAWDMNREHYISIAWLCYVL